MTKIMPFTKQGQWTDFRCLIEDAVREGRVTKRGIVIWVADDGAIRIDSVASLAEFAFAAAHLIGDVIKA